MTVEIQIDSPRNRDLYFRPLSRPLRGTFDFGRDPQVEAKMLLQRFPKPIPGLRIAVDADKKTATVNDPLHLQEHAPTRERIEKMGLKLGPASERFDNIDANTWLFWMRRAVAGGLARIVDGKFGEIDEEKAQKDFVNAPPKRDQRDTLIEKLVAMLYVSLPADKRKEVAALVGE